MAEFMTTDSISFEITRIIADAESEVTLVSPHLKLPRPLFEQLKATQPRGVKIKLIFDRADLGDNEKRWLGELDNVELYHMGNLRAKCYFNEDRMVIASMEMHEYWGKDYRDMGVLIKRDRDNESFMKAIGELQSILASSRKVDPTAEDLSKGTSFLMQDISLDVERIKEQSRAVIDFLKRDVVKTREDMKTVTEYLKQDVERTREDVKKSSEFLAKDVARTKEDLSKGTGFLKQDAEKTKEDLKKSTEFLKEDAKKTTKDLKKGARFLKKDLEKTKEDLKKGTSFLQRSDPQETE